MPTTMDINPRPSIHKQDSQISSHDEYEEDDFEETQYQHEETQIWTGSESEFEDDSSRTINRSPTITRVGREVSRSVQRSPTQKPLLSPESSSSSGISFTLLALGVVAAGCIIKFVFAAQNERTCSFEKLQTIYPQQNTRVWSILRIGIESILNKQIDNPALYLFVHHGDDDYIHKMVKDIASHSSSCFGKEMSPVEMSNDFTSSKNIEDYGNIIQKYKTKIKSGNVVLIANLNEIPAEAAKAFHTICDIYSPIVRDVVIFLTLRIPVAEQGNVKSITEDTLISLWGEEMGRNELDPLITRVTDQVILLNI